MSVHTFLSEDVGLIDIETLRSVSFSQAIVAASVRHWISVSFHHVKCAQITCHICDVCHSDPICFDLWVSHLVTCDRVQVAYAQINHRTKSPVITDNHSSQKHPSNCIKCDALFPAN